MAFPAEPARTPEEIGPIKIVLADDWTGAVPAGGYGDPENPQPYKQAWFELQIVMDDGRIVTRRGRLEPHLTGAQRAGLVDFMDSLRGQAIAQILRGDRE